MGSGAGLEGCHACIKYLMFAFNFIFWVSFLTKCSNRKMGTRVVMNDN